MTFWKQFKNLQARTFHSHDSSWIEVGMTFSIVGFFFYIRRYVESTEFRRWPYRNSIKSVRKSSNKQIMLSGLGDCRDPKKWRQDLRDIEQQTLAVVTIFLRNRDAFRIPLFKKNLRWSSKSPWITVLQPFIVSSVEVENGSLSLDSLNWDDIPNAI